MHRRLILHYPEELMDSPRLIASMSVGGKRCPWLETVFSEVSVASVQLVGSPEAIHMSGKVASRALARRVVPNPAF